MWIRNAKGGTKMKTSNIMLTILLALVIFSIMFVGAWITELLIDIIDDLGANDTSLIITKICAFILLAYIMIRQTMFFMKYVKEEETK